MFKLSQSIFRNLKSNNRKQLVIKSDKYFKSTVAEAQSVQTEDSLKFKRNAMVAAAFAAIKPSQTQSFSLETPFTDERISKATNVDELLSISEGDGVSRKHALKVVSTLADWSSSGKTKVTDFENDARFIRLCKILSKGAKISRNLVTRSEDLNTVLGVTADDEAARLISNLSLTQMIKVMSTLSARRRRSVVLLRTLAYNINGSNEQLDLKQCADLLYSMCLLSFIDDNLLRKISADVKLGLDTDLEKSTVVGSIVTSFGLLRYRNTEILDTLSEWILQNHSICRSQDLFSLFITLGAVNYTPNNSEVLYKSLLPLLTESEAKKPQLWLSFVWSLVILDQASTSHIESILNSDFVQKVEDNPAAQFKLMNINAAAKHLLKYEGPLLKTADFPILRSKDKKSLIQCVVDTLKNLVQDEKYLRSNAQTDFGFAIDVECLLDKKCKPLTLDRGLEDKDATRVAILVLDYPDMCLDDLEMNGANCLFVRILQSQNYKVLTVPYTEFRINAKLVQRVQYLENKLKSAVK